MCQAYDQDPLASLKMLTWCGGLGSDDKPQLGCSVDDQHSTTHFVKLDNLKTYDRKIQLRGELLRGRAEFKEEEARVKVTSEWEYEFDLARSASERVKAAQIHKKVNTTGSEWVDLDLKYNHQWTPNLMETANTSRLRLRIDVL